jgi:hypothetical protein
VTTSPASLFVLLRICPSKPKKIWWSGLHLSSWPGPGPGRRRAFFSSRYRDHDAKTKNWIYCNSFQITVVTLPNFSFKLHVKLLGIHPLAKKNRLLLEMKFTIDDQELTEEVCSPLARVRCPPLQGISKMCAHGMRTYFSLVNLQEHEYEHMV